MNKRSPNLRVTMSNANLPLKHAALYSVEQHRQIIQDVGADGMELTMIRSRLMAQVAMHTGARVLQETVTSLHMPYRRRKISEALGPIVANRDLHRAAEVVGMPRVDKSHRPMLRVQERVGRKLVAVVYPNEQALGKDTAVVHEVDFRTWRDEFAATAWQVTAEALHARGLLSRQPTVAIEGIREFGQQTGVEKVVFDTKHSTDVRDGQILPPWETYLPELVHEGDCIEMHVGPARTDVGGTTEQLNHILNGHIADTEIGCMLHAVRENVGSRPFDVVLELPEAALSAAEVGNMTYVEVNREVVAAIRGELGVAA